MSFSSRIPNFHNKSADERRKIIAELLHLSEDDVAILKREEVSEDVLDIMIENVIGKLSLPLGIATNFKVNGKDYLVPMATEESSVVAAASHAAKIARIKGGFTAVYSGSFTIGQLQICRVKDIETAKERLMAYKLELLEIANSTNEILCNLGGGAKDFELKTIQGNQDTYLLLHLIVDVKDAMGANAVNTMLEALKLRVEELTEGIVLLRIISNHATKRTVKVSAVFSKESLGGEEIVERILCAYDLADSDIYRGTTHNKGIMNGIIAVVQATGNDTRAIEAGAHSFAAKDGSYKSLSKYEKNAEGDLVGSMEIPLSLGLLGGAINVHPTYKLALKILGVSSSEEFANIVAAVGLAQNLAALRALVSEGIQQGHMALHARNIAVTAGAEGEEIERVANNMIKSGSITYDSAKKILDSEKVNKGV
ncbi:MAG: hydroxymethylglutaryl-CoA reductase, degradative [Candidatus Heimdallarchaeota archaeon]|nr:hydroxymethylglutaryl-CoA reductase, degradative [Candidatus Heimdallarchaeota archaeon]